MTTQTKHTELPYRLYRRRTRTTIIDSNTYANILEGVNSRENFEFIVKACNNHYQLLEACKLAIKCVAKAEAEEAYKKCVLPKIGEKTIEILNQAINQAEGKE